MISAAEGSVAVRVSAALCHAASYIVFFVSLPPALDATLVDNNKPFADSEGETLGGNGCISLKSVLRSTVHCYFFSPALVTYQEKFSSNLIA